MDEAARGRFTFIVATTANKNIIATAVEEQFKVTVVSVQTIITKGKGARAGKRRIQVKLSPQKKAIVRLAKGQKIDLFDTKEEKEKKEEKKTK